MLHLHPDCATFARLRVQLPSPVRGSIYTAPSSKSGGSPASIAGVRGSRSGGLRAGVRSPRGTTGKPTHLRAHVCVCMYVCGCVWCEVVRDGGVGPHAMFNGTSPTHSSPPAPGVPPSLKRSFDSLLTCLFDERQSPALRCTDSARHGFTRLHHVRPDCEACHRISQSISGVHVSRC